MENYSRTRKLSPHFWVHLQVYSMSLLAEISEETELVAISLKRLVSDPLISRFHNRIINTHPTLLPAYKGFGANKKMLNEGENLFGGCSLHLVDELADFAEQRLDIVGNHAKIDNATYSYLLTNPEIEIDFTLLDKIFITE